MPLTVDHDLTRLAAAGLPATALATERSGTHGATIVVLRVDADQLTRFADALQRHGHTLECSPLVRR